MGAQIQDTMRQLLISALEDRAGKSNGTQASESSGPLSGGRGIAAGAGAALLVPFAVKRLAKGVDADGLRALAQNPADALKDGLGDRITSGLGDIISSKVDDAGGPAGILKDAARSVLPFGGGEDDDDDDDDGSIPGVGKGRRMPVQQTIDIAAPRETVYNQWTQFEHWPSFMHRVVEVEQEDDCTIACTVKIWGKTKEFTAKIETQRPDERIKWRVEDGMRHTGVVTFHELTPGLTRVLLGLDVEPEGMLEKLARGARHVKRAARGDLHRFKAFVEMAERETGAWRGVIEGGKVVEKHDRSYDSKREYADLDAIRSGASQDRAEADGAKARGSGGRSRSSSSSARRTSSRSTGRSASQSRGRSATAKSQSSARSSSSSSRNNGRGSAKSSRSSGGAKKSAGTNGGKRSSPARGGSSSKSSQSRARSSADGGSGGRRTTRSRSSRSTQRAEASHTSNRQSRSSN